MPGEVVYSTPRLRAARLDSIDGRALQALLERSRDFFELVYGHPPGPAEAQSLFVGLPEGKDYDDKFLLGLYNDAWTLVGVIDAIRDYVEPGRWALGLLLIDPSRRGARLGREAYEGFERWAAALGARLVRIAVQRQNEAARRFWEGIGFAAVESKKMLTGILDSDVDVMARGVPQATP
jgi:GNAT superfamily N-acetyltransferase